jgi:hypothetical protein
MNIKHTLVCALSLSINTHRLVGRVNLVSQIDIYNLGKKLVVLP